MKRVFEKEYGKKKGDEVLYKYENKHKNSGIKKKTKKSK